MAGVGTVLTLDSLRNGTWYLCPDGWPLEPLDILHLTFPNKGRNAAGDNLCFDPRRMSFPWLRSFLPDATDFLLPDDFVDACVALFYVCIIVTLCMVLVKYVWERVDSRFGSITPEHKKWYVVANLSKAFFLGSMMFSTRYWMGSYRSLFQDRFAGVEVKRTGMMYITTDVVSLFIVPKLPTSTMLHHVSTASLVMIVTTLNLTLKGWQGLLGVCKMTLIYGIFSSVAFCVNIYLALRVVYPKAKWLPALVHLSLWPYILLCAVNWSIHAVWLVRMIVTLDITIATVLYLMAISTMVHDDIVLIKWLWKRSSPMASHGHENGVDTKKEQ